MYIYFITAILGCIRDYSKTKYISILKFIRTPLIIFLINYILKNYNVNNSVLKAIILERWVFLLLKTLISVYNNDYYNKKEKYKIKYNIIY
tara:strand:+ start:4306 stop:4578 length:273 start_codon:yes stop_codon:yes gene_type:complete